MVPQLAQGDGVIRVWCAGCATGEEAYTIAMVLSEVLKLLDAAMGSGGKPASEEVEAVNRRGRSFLCAIRAFPLITPNHGVSGALVLMADADGGGLPPELPAG